MMPVTTPPEFYHDCRLFSGYKPCRYKRPCMGCPHYDPAQKRILVISLEAMGAVLRSTCLLPAIKRAYPEGHITWVTYGNAKPLLEHNPLIDRLIVYDHNTMAILHHLSFDILFAVDKSLEAGALAEYVRAPDKRGFGLTPFGTIRPLNDAAIYQYQVGLDDELKFRINQKPETQQITESMALPWVRDPYVLQLTEAEKQQVSQFRAELTKGKLERKVIGYNTGCSLLFPYKKLTVSHSIAMIDMWRNQFPESPIALLGGREDEQRQFEIKQAFANDSFVINTPTSGGLRRGILWMDATDVVFSGCSLGMHIAIGLEKKVIAWFGESCIQEVDLYDRGVKIQSKVPCSPCWKKSCTNDPKCYDMVPLEEVRIATESLLV